MKIVFFGTSQFAVGVLRKLAAKSYSIAAVVTRPDKKSGRHLKISASPVKREAEKLHLPIYQPADINEETFLEGLKGVGADFFVVVEFGRILTENVLDIPKICSLNIHPSLLPKYRGAAPVRWALINGEEKTGVTIIRMNERMDAGDIVLQKELEMGPSDTKETLEPKLISIGGELLIDALESIKKGKAYFTPQGEKGVTFAPRLTKKDGKIDWNQDTASILNRIRGLKPWPGTYIHLKGRNLRIISGEAKSGKNFSRFSPGDVVVADEKEGLVVKTGDAAILITEVQLEGKKQLSAQEFLRGHKINVGAKLE